MIARCRNWVFNTCSQSYTLKGQFSNVSEKMKDVPTLGDFMKGQSQKVINNHLILNDQQSLIGKKYYIETYGCQMNEADSEIVNSILQTQGMQQSGDLIDSDLILLNTCSIRENAEAKVWNRLHEIKAEKKKNKKEFLIGVLGCMAERLKVDLIEKTKSVDLVVGPDAYRDLPRLVTDLMFVDDQAYKINTQLSFDETYADILPVRNRAGDHRAYISIMRGCNNMCTFCIVPFTRGRERSRPLPSILEEVKILRDQGIKVSRALK